MGPAPDGAGPAGGPGRVVFVFHRLGLEKAGLTRAVLQRLACFDAAGWDVHLALVGQDDAMERTVATLRADGRLPAGVVVRDYRRERRRQPAHVARRLRRVPAEERTAAWLDTLIPPAGALVFADAPEAVPLVARLRAPGAARVLVVHLAHLAGRVGPDPTREDLATGPLTRRMAELVEPWWASLDHVVALTDRQADELRLRFGTAVPITVIPHFVDPPTQPRPAGYDPLLVAGLGRLEPAKRWEHALVVIDQVRRHVPDARLVVHGIGSERERLEALAAQRPVGSVAFPGYSREGRAFLAGAACMLGTSRREGFGLTFVEALAEGTPVVTYDVRYGPREIVRDGLDGFVVPAGDTAAAAAAVVRLLREPDLRARMSNSARAVTTRFSRAAYESAWAAFAPAALSAALR